MSDTWEELSTLSGDQQRMRLEAFLWSKVAEVAGKQIEEIDPSTAISDQLGSAEHTATFIASIQGLPLPKTFVSRELNNTTIPRLARLLQLKMTISDEPLCDSEGMVEPHPTWGEHCEDFEITVEKVCPTTDQFLEVLSVRQSAYRDTQYADKIDEYSRHYLARVDGEPAASLCVTRRRDGPLDCERFFPSRLLDTCNDVIGSACRFAAIQLYPVDIRLAPLLVETAWQDQLAAGARLDIINVHERAIRYYGRLGYWIIKGMEKVGLAWDVVEPKPLFQTKD